MTIIERHSEAGLALESVFAASELLERRARTRGLAEGAMRDWWASLIRERRAVEAIGIPYDFDFVVSLPQDGRHPEFHGYVKYNIAFFCPCCMDNCKDKRP